MYQFLIEYALTFSLLILFFVQLAYYNHVESGKAHHSRIVIGRDKGADETNDNYYYGMSSEDIPYGMAGFVFVAIAFYVGLVYFVLFNIQHFSFSPEHFKSVDAFINHVFSDNNGFQRSVVAEVVAILGSMLILFYATKSTLSYYKTKGYGVRESTLMASLSEGAKRVLKDNNLLSETDLYRWQTFSIKYSDYRMGQLMQINKAFSHYLEMEGQFYRFVYLNKETDEVKELRGKMEEQLALIKKMVESVDVWRDYVYSPAEEEQDALFIQEEAKPVEKEESASLPTEIHELKKIIQNPHLPDSLKVEASVLLKKITTDNLEKKKKEREEQEIQDAEITLETIKRMRRIKTD